MIYLNLVNSFFVKFFAAWLLKLNRAFCFFLFWSDMMSILHVVQSHSHSILSINYRLQITELIKTTEFELKHGFSIGFRHIRPINMKYRLYISDVLKVTSILVTDVGDQMCWWQVWDVGDRFRMFVTDSGCWWPI